jgi:hypothetical protein
MPMLVYENSDWIVDSEGIHTKHPPPDYNIFFRSLYDMRDTLEGDMFEWPLHMAHKSGINIHLFNDAFSKAMRYHATLNHRGVDEDLLRRSCEEAVGIVQVRRLRR